MGRLVGMVPPILYNFMALVGGFSVNVYITSRNLREGSFEVLLLTLGVRALATVDTVESLLATHSFCPCQSRCGHRPVRRIINIPKVHKSTHFT